ncbi:signal peptidase I [Bifidobacterium miconis]|nr:signal peptidase I [Bifidobacterium miconis]
MQSNDEDRHTLMVSDHGVNPEPLPSRAEFEAMAGGANGEPNSARNGGAQGDEDGQSGWRDFLIWCGVPVLVVLLVRILLIGCYVIPSGSMMNTIEPGDKVVTSKLTPRVFDLKRGDVVVFKDPANWLSAEYSGNLGGDYLIKRLIGLPGDVVECEGAGQPVKVNGVAVDETSYLRPGVEPSAFPFRVEVTAGHVFVLGDNRANSADSRYHQDDGDHGLVPVDDVVGVAVARYWPIDRIGLFADHRDVFADVPDGSESQQS